MPITLKLNNLQPEPEPAPPQATVSLEISQTLDGNLLINDHQYIDIVVVPKDSKVVTLPKPYAEKDVYDYQQALMYSLFKSGVINGPVQGGATFGMVEAVYPTSPEVDPVQAVLYQIDKFITSSRAEGQKAEEYDKNIEDNFTDPPDSETTAYGEIPPFQDTPGANQIGDPTYTFAGYGYLY
jgi:hypothetical protein